MKRHGLLFKINDQCLIAEYTADGIIVNASPIDDDEEDYKYLSPYEMELVEIVGDGEAEDGENVSLLNLKTITIKNKEDLSFNVESLLDSGKFPDVAKDIFDGENLGETV